MTLNTASVGGISEVAWARLAESFGVTRQIRRLVADETAAATLAVATVTGYIASFTTGDNPAPDALADLGHDAKAIATWLTVDLVRIARRTGVGEPDLGHATDHAARAVRRALVD